MGHLHTQLVVPHHTLVAALRALVTSPGQLAVTPLGQSSSPARLELLAGSRLTALPASASAPGAQTLIIGHTDVAVQGNWRARQLLDDQQPGGVRASLVVGGDDESGSISAWAQLDSRQAIPIDTIQIVGPGIHRIGAIATHDVPLPEEVDRWSRLINVLGVRVWEQLRQLTVAIVGCGRTGSLAASTLARTGVGRLVLIDSDRIETHNLDAMDVVDDEAIGQPKVTALAAALYRTCPGTRITACVESVTAVTALELLKEADIVVSCVDNDGARWATGVLCALYLKPLLDIGTGIVQSGQDLEMGADIRLVLPGDGCLHCAGGFARPGQVVALRVSATTELQVRRESHWQTERVGSLRSLNQLAVGLGLRATEAFLIGQIRRTEWSQLYFDAAGAPSITRPAVLPRSACPLCALQGMGDRGLLEARRLPQPGLPG